MSRAEQLELLAALEEKARRAHVYRYKTMFAGRYDWQKQFIANTSKYSQTCLMAANRVGKTETGVYIDAIHALGEYPEGWEGHRFETAPLIWILGYSGEKLRDLLQTPLIGSVSEGSCSGGLIPAERVVDLIPSGVPRLAKEVQVKHISGGISRIQLWSYSQGQHALMGDSVDWFHIDEEPKDDKIYPQVLTRTATGDNGKGGRGILTFTPENGRTELVIKFMDDPSPAQSIQTVGWDDAPHLSEEVKTNLLASFPAHQKDMRTKGIPMLGEGRIYDISEDRILCKPFEIPVHFKVIDGMDFGWDHPQSQVQLVIDLDTDTYYVTKAWKSSQTTPDQAWGATKKWAADVPTAWPQDGLQSEKSSGNQQKKAYQVAGFSLLPEHATWADGSNGVEAGIFEIRDLMIQGRFKVFEGLREWVEEFLQYHRDNGKIVKTRDDLLDATRYAYMMRRHAKAYGDIGKKRETKPKARPVGGWMG